MTYDKNNIFARIIRGEISCEKIYEDDSILAIEDIEPAAPVHVLIMPKGEYVSFDDFSIMAKPDKIAHFFKIVGQIAKMLKVDASGYRLIANHGHNASQSVAHFHIHLLAGRPLGGLLPGDHLHR